MFCRKCGAQNADNVSQCVQCGNVLQQAVAAGPPRSIPNYLVQSILVTIFCCWPFGIPAIVFAAQVNGKLGQGDIQGAMDASAKAKMWSWIAFGLGLTGIVLYLLFIIVMAVGTARHGMH